MSKLCLYSYEIHRISYRIVIILKLSPNCTLITADFTALYQRIDHSHAINVITEFMSDKLNKKFLSVAGFKMLLQTVLENNLFMFNNNYF